jgi:hypothetical protein
MRYLPAKNKTATACIAAGRPNYSFLSGSANRQVHGTTVAASVGAVSPELFRALTPTMIGTPLGWPVNANCVFVTAPASVSAPLLLGRQTTRSS